jgi:hypothetical protein
MGRLKGLGKLKNHLIGIRIRDLNLLRYRVPQTAVMDVISFLCVSLSSSIVQHHNSPGIRRACACSQAGFSSQNGDRA